jgi:hypothetical protein
MGFGLKRRIYREFALESSTSSPPSRSSKTLVVGASEDPERGDEVVALDGVVLQMLVKAVKRKEDGREGRGCLLVTIDLISSEMKRE